MDKALRNTLRNVVTYCRRRLEEAIGEMLQGAYGIHADGVIEDAARLKHLTPEEQRYRERVRVHLEHIKSSGPKPREAVAQLIREAAFTHLNRLCAYKLMAQRGLLRDVVGKGLKSSGFLFYLADHPQDEELYHGAQAELAYRHFLEWQNAQLAGEIGVLFAPDDLAGGVFPPQRVLDEVLAKLNQDELRDIWAADETIGWVYQYFTPKELRDTARKESAAPRNSYEMAFRNQFFTPRYVVEFLTDNTLGRTWYEMRGGDTALAEKCRYLASGPSQEEGSKQTAHRAPRTPKKDPREIRVLDPACGSGHFLLYCFDLFQTIYQEAYDDPQLGAALQRDFPDAAEFQRAIPGLILCHNLHGIDIDLRVTQLAGLALWLRAQRAFQEMGLPGRKRPAVRAQHIVCAEPMPGEQDLLDEFTAELQPRILGELVRKVFERMKLAGEAGALIRIEDDIREPLAEARRAWQEMKRQADLCATTPALALFDWRVETPQQRQQKLSFERYGDISDENFWEDAETLVLDTLRDYARRAVNGKGLLRQLFAGDAAQGFAFIDVCRKKFDVVLMNPPFGDASLPSKAYIDETYGDTKGDVYKAFVEGFQDRLTPGGYLGIISSRTGFFLSGSSDWRERVVLRLYRPLLLADFGMGVLDAMVETAGYVLRSLTEAEAQALTLQLAGELARIPTDKRDCFSTKKYQDTHSLKRHQANQELDRLHRAGFIAPVAGSFPRWTPQRRALAKLYVPPASAYPPLVCLRLLGETDKGAALHDALHHDHDPRRFTVAPEDFRQVPKTPFCYWVSNSIRSLFVDLRPFEGKDITARQGIATADDNRFLRLWWEARPEQIVPPYAHPKIFKGSYCILGAFDWIPFAKGGAYSSFYADIHLIVRWSHDGSAIKQNVLSRYPYLNGNWSFVVKNTEFNFAPGLTWTLRTTSNFSIRVLPAGCMFGHKGPSIFAKNEAELMELLLVMQSSCFQMLFDMNVGAAAGAAKSYENGIIQRLPKPLTRPLEHEIQIIRFAISRKSLLDTANETSHVFHLPALLQVAAAHDLGKCVEAWQEHVSTAERQLAAYQQEIDDIACRLYGISPEEVAGGQWSVVSEKPKAVAGGQGSVVSEKPKAVAGGQWSVVSEEQAEETATDDEGDDEALTTGHRPLTTDLLSYAVGCALGRWDVRLATGERVAPELPDPFAPLPVCAPAALQGADGLPLAAAPAGYPLLVAAEGILVDDPTHPDDIITRLHSVFELIWPETAERRLHEACTLLGVKELRDYFRKPAAGGFWADHIKRYSKSRRKAPIYWLLQSSRKNYALWLYYHRLDRDMLHKARLNYVEPKLNLEENRLLQLKTQRAALGIAGSAAKNLEKELDRQEALLGELHDFHDKLRRVADMNLDFDLNDGVVLNIAPLWELTPWTEAKRYWQELAAGKYEWSAMSQQLRERGWVKG